MEVTSTLTSKGQTTVPLEVRKVLGLGPRQRIVYEIEGNHVHIRAGGASLLAAAGALADGTPAKSRDEERTAYHIARGERYTAQP